MGTGCHVVLGTNRLDMSCPAPNRTDEAGGPPATGVSDKRRLTVCDHISSRPFAAGLRDPTGGTCQ